MGKRSYFRLSSEDERQLVLDLAQIISAYGKDGADMSSILNEAAKSHEGIKPENIIRIVKLKLTKCLGNISVGKNRWTRYVIDDLDVACQLINDYYDKGMSELEIWDLRKRICKYILENPGVTTETIEDEFSVEQEFIDEMNSDLVKYNVGIDFYKTTSHGTKMRVSDLVVPAISGIISDISKKATPPVKKSEKEDKLVKLDESTKRMIQTRLIELIYRKDRVSEYDISKLYLKVFGENIKYPAIKSMMNGIPGIGISKDGYYWVKDINEALSFINPIKGKVNVEVISKTELDLNKYRNLKFSRSIENLYVYTLDCSNSYETVMDIFDLIINGASIDPKISNRVLEIVKENMKYGDKFLL